MNCQDISLAMDDRDIGALSEAQRREFDAHLATCPDCARDWEIHMGLAATRIPPLPADLQHRIEMSLPVRAGAPGHAIAKRLVVIGAVVAFAAAAMFAVHWMGTPTPAAAPTTPAAPIALAVPAPAPEVIETVVSTVPAKAPPAKEAAAGEASQPEQPKPLVKLHTVRVLPLQTQATGPAFAAVETFFAAFLTNLRESPGVEVIAPEQPEPLAAAAAEVRFGVRGFGPVSEGRFSIVLILEHLQSDGSYKQPEVVSLTGDIAAACAGSPPFDTMQSCRSPSHIAGAIVRNLRAGLLSPDASLQGDPQSRLADRSLSPDMRLKALTELGDKRGDPAVVRGAVDLATTAADPEIRRYAWSQMVNVRSPELVSPLVETMLRDPDAEVRVQAMVVGVGFADDPRVRDAYATIAQSDPQPMLRALGRRGFAGEESWNRYMAASLKDASRSDSERIEALAFELSRPVPMDLQGFLKDNDALPALKDLLPRMVASSSASNQPLGLLSRLSTIDDPAIIDLVLQSVEKLKSREAPGILRNMLANRSGDSRIRAALEKISAEEPDPNVRQSIAEMLKKP